MNPGAFEVGFVHFLRPLWLLGLPLLPVMWWAWKSRQRRQSVWRESVDAHLLPHLLESTGGGDRRGWLLPIAAMLALALALIALSGPGWRKVEQPLWQTRAPLVVALDLSSMSLADDLPPSRLLQARAKIGELLKARQGGQVALVAYSEDAYTVAPLTDDVANIALFLDALHPDVMPEDGNRTGRAIDWSQRLLRQAGFDRGDILLMTGEADVEAREAAAQAATHGYRVSVLGLGTSKGAAYRRADGSIGQAKLEAASLQALAGRGGGAYQPLSADRSDLDALGVLDPALAGARSAQGEKGSTWLDEGFWLLPPLLLLAALGFRRNGLFAVLVLALCLPLLPLPAQAQEAGLWRRPDQAQYQRMQQGERAYREGDFEAASQAFGGVDGADGAYNFGNALAQQGRYEEAIAAYDRALQQQPGMADAIANRKAVEEAMKRNPPKGPSDKPNPQDQQRGDSQSRPGSEGEQGQGQPGDQQSPASPQQREGQPRDGEPQGQGEQQQRDPDDQRAADEAQRQRMQQALEKNRQQRQAEDGQDIEGRPDRAEQAAQRERSVANEAWLRRVPDDPGALLRAKFRIEHERRREEGRD